MRRTGMGHRVAGLWGRGVAGSRVAGRGVAGSRGRGFGLAGVFPIATVSNRGFLSDGRLSGRQSIAQRCEFSSSPAQERRRFGEVQQDHLSGALKRGARGTTSIVGSLRATAACHGAFGAEPPAAARCDETTTRRAPQSRGLPGEIRSIDMKAEACGSHLKNDRAVINGSPPLAPRRPFAIRSTLTPATARSAAPPAGRIRRSELHVVSSRRRVVTASVPRPAQRS